MKTGKDLKVVFFGTPSFVIPVLESLEKNFNLLGVVTTPDTIQGRKKLLTPTPVKVAYEKYLRDANKKGMAITPKTLNPTIEKVLEKLKPDLFVVAAYGMIIPKSILKIPRYGSLNIHPSLLPKYRGPSPIQTTLLNGDAESGISIILMDEEVDHGPILTVKKIDLSPSDTFESLHISMFQTAAEMLPQAINDFISGRIEAKEQDHTKAVFCQHIAKQDGYLNLDNPPSKEQLDRMIRAYYPWPTAWTKWNGKIMKLLPQNRVQLEGGKPMHVKDFLNGYPDMKETIEKILSL